MKKHSIIGMAVAITLIGFGCSTADKLVSHTGPVVEVVPEQKVDKVTTSTQTNQDGAILIMRTTNTVITPPVYYTNVVVSPAVQSAGEALRVIGEASGVPWTDLAVKGLLAGAAAAAGWYNLIQRNKLKKNEDHLATAREVMSELKDNVGTVLATLPEPQQKVVKAELQQSQIAAGPDVAAKIKEVLKEG